MCEPWLPVQCPFCPTLCRRHPVQRCPTASPTASSSPRAEDVALCLGFGTHLHAQLVEQADYSHIHLGIFFKGPHFLWWVHGLESAGHFHRGKGGPWPPPQSDLALAGRGSRAINCASFLMSVALHDVNMNDRQLIVVGLHARSWLWQLLADVSASVQ